LSRRYSTRTPVSVAFGTYIKGQWERTTNPKGVPLGEKILQGQAREQSLKIYKEEDDSSWRQRCLDSPLYFEQIKETIEGKFPEMLVDSDGNRIEFDLDFVDAMVEWARERIRNPQIKPLALKIRKEICKDRVEVTSNQPAGGGSVALREHPDFESFNQRAEARRRQNELEGAARRDEERREAEAQAQAMWYENFGDFRYWHRGGWDDWDDWYWDDYDRGWKEFAPWGGHWR